MKQITATVLLMFGLCLTADADIWKWVDDQGNVHYGDTPARDYTKSAERVNYTASNRSSSTSSNSRKDTQTEKRTAQEDAQAYYCEQAKDIYRSYLDAPRLYKTGEDGQREYLSDEEAAATIAQARASVTEWCN